MSRYVTPTVQPTFEIKVNLGQDFDSKVEPLPRTRWQSHTAFTLKNNLSAVKTTVEQYTCLSVSVTSDLAHIPLQRLQASSSTS